MQNISMFELVLPEFKIDKPIRLIELFAGVGSQAMALRNIGADFEHYKVIEFDKFAIESYNAIHGTDFETTDITEITGEDLEINNTDKYEYILTYSFPCQDLSLAGNREGMTKGSGTRSGLLWEVERLLNEVEELPQVLLMENVPQVISQANIADFHKWQQFLEEKGYSNYTGTLNAKDYGVAQNRNRTFMVSILGECSYRFPSPKALTKTMKDYLEDEVEEKYYIKNKKAQELIQQLIEGEQLDQEITCVDGSRNDAKAKKVMNCITAGYDKGISSRKSMGGAVVEKKEIIQIGNIVESKNRENPTAGRVYDKEGLCPTINCMEGGHRQPMVVEPTIVRSVGRNPNNPSDRTKGSPTKQRLEPNSQGICNTITTVQKDNLVLEPSILRYERTQYGKRIRKEYENGEVEEKIGNMRKLKPREDGISNTLTTVQKDNLVLEPKLKFLGGLDSNKRINDGKELSRNYKEGYRVYDSEGLAACQKSNGGGLGGNTGLYAIKENEGEPTVKVKQATKEGYIECKLGGVADLSYPNSTTRRGRVQDSGDTSPTITATETGVHKIESPYRIRKLTPRECARLMKFSDKDADKMLEVNSNSQVYKQCGNSIVVSVLEAIFLQMNIKGCPTWDEYAKDEY